MLFLAGTIILRVPHGISVRLPPSYGWVVNMTSFSYAGMQ